MIDPNYDKVFKAYRAEWEQIHLCPRRRRPHLMDYAQFLIFVPIAVLGPLVSAFRTAALIKAHTAFQSEFWSVAEMLLATFVFETAAIAYQLERLRRKMGGEEKLPEIGTFWIIIGMVAAVGAVTVSNLVEIGVVALASAGVMVPPVVSAVAIGLFIGGGIPIMTIVAGEIGGRFLLEYQVEDRRLRQEHEEALQAWEERFIGSWNRVKRKRLAGSSQSVADSDRRGDSDQVVAEVVAVDNGRRGANSQADSARQPRTSEAMAGHLSAIRQTVADRQQFGGNGTFKRADVEAWREVSTSQAKNILRYGRERGVLELVGDNQYRFLS